MRKTDEQIKSDIVSELKWDARVDASNIKVTVDAGIVELSGNISSYLAKRAARECAHSVYGVVSVIDNIEVAFPVTYNIPTDEEIKNNALNAILWDSEVDSSKIEIKVENGIVTLQGTTDAFWKKKRAENDIEFLSGVIAVKNELSIVPTKSLIDEDIAEDILASLRRKVDVAADKVNVYVKNGVVTLSGKVEDYSAWLAAYNSAENTLGVIDVKDKIQIK